MSTFFAGCWLRFGLLVALLFASLLLLIFSADSGIGAFLVGLTCATVPVPIYAALMLWIDRFEPEPPWMLALAFFLGARWSPTTVSIVMNSIVELTLGREASVVFIRAPFSKKFQSDDPVHFLLRGAKPILMASSMASSTPEWSRSALR